MKYGASFVAHVGRMVSPSVALHNSMRKVQLAQLSKVEMYFDPFSGEQAQSLRTFAFHVDTSRIRQTNFKCSVKLNVVCDRSEPRMNLTYNNGEKVLFKTSNLTSGEIADEFLVLAEIHERKAEEAAAAKRRR